LVLYDFIFSMVIIIGSDRTDLEAHRGSLFIMNVFSVQVFWAIKHLQFFWHSCPTNREPIHIKNTFKN